MMKTILALAVCLAFLLLGLWHFNMARKPFGSTNSAVPSVDGKPLFVPSRAATVAVGVVLILFALLVAATSGLLVLDLPAQWLRWASAALAAGLLARAVGDFRYVGFFKKVRGSAFARMDTLAYSPLCLALSAGVAALAWWP